MDKQRSSTIDFARGLAIFGVIGIHLVAAWEQYIPFRELVLNRERYILFDQILRFCVPLFVACSGFVLAARYGKGVGSWSNFYRKRLLRLFPLYLFWSLVIWLVTRLSPTWQGYISGQRWQDVIFLGKADYHLYFVPMIVQLYLFFPVILILLRRFGWKVLIGAAVFQAAYFFWIETKLSGPMWGGFWSDQEQYIRAASWLFYFVAGTYLGLKGWTSGGKRLSFYVGLAAIAAGLAWSFRDAVAQILAGKDILVATRFTRLPVLLYGAGVVAAALNMAEIGKSTTVRTFWNAASWMGKHSYSIFLGHTLLLRVIFSHFKHDVPVPVLAVALFVIIVGAFISLRVEGN